MFRLESILIFISLLCLKVFKCEEVGQLTTDNFDSITANHELVFINFYADWCRFSQILAPVFEEAYAKVKQDFPEPNRVFFGKVDCEAQSSLASRFHITKYPTLKLIINRKTAKKEYRGQRSIEAITAFVKDLLKDPVKVITTQDDDTEIVKKQGAIVAYSHEPPANNPALYDVFRKVAIDLKSDCNFFWITGEKAPSNMLITENLRIVFKPPRIEIGSQDVTYPGTLQSYDEFSTWSTNKCIPLVREITFENAEELTEEGLPFLILFHNPDDRKSVEFYTEIVHKELYSESPSINFLTADGQKFAHPLHHLGKSSKDLPLIAIDSFRHMYLFPNYEDIKISGKLAQFVQDLHSGKLHRVFHFGPEPDQDAHSDNQIMTSPPESTFKKLAPSRNRYTLLRDEL